MTHLYTGRKVEDDVNLLWTPFCWRCLKFLSFGRGTHPPPMDPTYILDNLPRARGMYRIWEKSPDMLNLEKVRVTVVKGGGPASRFSKGAGSSPRKSLIFIKKSSHQRRRGGVLTPWTHPLYAPLQEPCYALTTYECNTFKLLLLTVL